MDTHKYMSEITRTALQVIAKHGITSESKPEEIDAVEKELVEKKVYKDYPSAKGRVRRALFTYFRAYGCLNDVEQLRDLVYNDKAKDNYDNEFEHLCFEEKTHDISDIDRQRLQEMRAAKRQNRRFPEKVLKYLWDDAFKFNRETVFDVTNYSSLEAVIRKFVDSEARDRMAVFNQTIVNTFTGTQQ